MKEEKIYQCECGKVFKSCQALCGHKANCQIHKDAKKLAEELLKQEREARRLPNGLFKCDNPNCTNEHDGSYGSGRFCSKSCYKSYVGIQSGKSKKNRKHTNPIKRLKDRAPYGTWKCKRCNLVFETRRQLEAHNHEVHPIKKGVAWNKGLTKETDERIAIGAEKVSKTLKDGFKNGKFIQSEWTDERRARQSKYAKDRKLGGYHKNGGKGKRGRYRGFWCDSSWELAYVIWNLEHNVKFSRNTKGFPYVFENEVHQYHPDFLLEDGTYVEIKGWYDNKTLIKHQTFRDLGYKLQVIDKNNIEMYLTYAVEKYGNDFIKLYEET